jgi:tRNA1Val (adenine37-N6)-methyltransferase
MARPPFRFKRFDVALEGAAHPLGTDSVLLGAWAAVDGVGRALDVGTGTGAVALMLAQRTEATEPPALIDAVELHEPSQRCARANFAASPWAGRLHLYAGSVQEFARQARRPYDLVVCNPPFFTETVVSPDAGRRLGRNTTSLTFSDLVVAVRALLAPTGRFCAVVPPVEGQRLVEIAAVHGLYLTARVYVTPRPGKAVERWLLQFERSGYDFQQHELFIYAAEERYSPEFRALTGAFYLDF